MINSADIIKVASLQKSLSKGKSNYLIGIMYENSSINLNKYLYHGPPKP